MLEKAKLFYDGHKKLILITAGGIVVVAAGFIVGKKLLDIGLFETMTTSEAVKEAVLDGIKNNPDGLTVVNF